MSATGIPLNGEIPGCGGTALIEGGRAGRVAESGAPGGVAGSMIERLGVVGVISAVPGAPALAPPRAALCGTVGTARLFAGAGAELGAVDCTVAAAPGAVATLPEAVVRVAEVAVPLVVVVPAAGVDVPEVEGAAPLAPAEPEAPLLWAIPGALPRTVQRAAVAKSRVFIE